ncbi:Ank2 [Symbiodinium microadriaticum]|nr:Ank2 [Symbiodinium microadriaticum]CAE7947846.1 Ank2 [Symbiodinium sp. KB8]
MLRVWRPSGEEVASFPISSFRDVYELKRRLHMLLGVPRIRQRVLDGGAVLDDDTQLASIADVQLVLLPLCQSSAEDAELFIQAVFRDHRRTVFDMLRRCHNPNMTARFRNEHLSPIHAAAKAGHPSMVSLLLEAGAQDISDTGDQLALADSASRGTTRVLRLLLEAGGDAGRALHVASGAGQLQVVDMLLEKHCDKITTQAHRASLVAASTVHDAKILWRLLEVDRLGFFDWGWALAVLASLAGTWKLLLRSAISAAVVALSCLGSRISPGEGDGVTDWVLSYCRLVGLTTLVVWAIPFKILLLLLWGQTAQKVIVRNFSYRWRRRVELVTVRLFLCGPVSRSRFP